MPHSFVNDIAPDDFVGGNVAKRLRLANGNAFIREWQIPECLNRCQSAIRVDGEGIERAAATALHIKERTVRRYRGVRGSGMRDRGLGVQEGGHADGGFTEGTHVTAARVRAEEIALRARNPAQRRLSVTHGTDQCERSDRKST